LRQAADNLTEELIAMADKLPRSQFVRCIAIVSQMKIIANSLDESSPALHSVTTPGEPTSAKVMGFHHSSKQQGCIAQFLWLSAPSCAASRISQ